MGPVDPFEPAELGSYRLWKSFSRKVDNILKRMEAELRITEPVTDVQWRWMDYPAINSKGVGWSWPTDRPVGYRSFWYYLGFQFASTPWFIRLMKDAEPEAVVAVGLWTEPRCSLSW